MEEREGDPRMSGEDNLRGHVEVMRVPGLRAPEFFYEEIAFAGGELNEDEPVLDLIKRAMERLTHDTALRPTAIIIANDLIPDLLLNWQFTGLAERMGAVASSKRYQMPYSLLGVNVLLDLNPEARSIVVRAERRANG
jgi:hypothetical protein